MGLLRLRLHGTLGRDASHSRRAISPNTARAKSTIAVATRLWRVANKRRTAPWLHLTHLRIMMRQFVLDPWHKRRLVLRNHAGRSSSFGSAPAPAHRRARRRHGHHDPALQIVRAGLSGKTISRLERKGPERQPRTSAANEARVDRGNSRAVS